MSQWLIEDDLVEATGDLVPLVPNRGRQAFSVGVEALVQHSKQNEGWAPLLAAISARRWSTKTSSCSWRCDACSSSLPSSSMISSTARSISIARTVSRTRSKPAGSPSASTCSA